MSAVALRAPWPFRLTLVLALALTLFASDVAAQEANVRAKALFDKAEVHFSLREFDKALKFYGAAYRVKPMPEFLFNMGQCHRYLGNHERAIFHYKQFMLKKPSSPQRPQVEQLVAESEGKLRAERAASAGPGTGAPCAATSCLSRGWFWAGVGLTTALTLTSITTGVVASGQGPHEDTRALEITSWVTLGGAVVAAASTVGLFWLSRSKPQKVDGSLRLVPLVAQRSGGVLLEGRF